MRILVTGGAGFIGSHLVDRLAGDGHDIVVVDNLFRGNLDYIGAALDAGKVSFVDTDVRDFHEMRRVCEGCEVVFHLAAQSNVMGAVQDLTYSFETNVIGSFNALKAAAESKVRRFIFASSREVYGEAQTLPVGELHPLEAKNSYGASKMAGEAYCRVFRQMGALEMAVFRFGNVYGERDTDRVIPIFLDNLTRGEKIRIFGGEQVIDFVAIEVIAGVLMQALVAEALPDGPINVGAGRGTTLHQLAQRLMQLTGRANEVIVEPARAVEVVKFTADIQQLRGWYKQDIPADPLYYLETMIRRGWPELAAAAATQN